MGYEVTMYVVETGSTDHEKQEFVKYDGRWSCLFDGRLAFGADGNARLNLSGFEPRVNKWYASKVAMVELCKVGDYPATEIAEYFFYDMDGNTPVIEDRYGVELGQISVPDMIAFIKKQNNGYRRFKTALSVLESLGEEYRNPIVLLFGH